jgi:hypothetical protein
MLILISPCLLVTSRDFQLTHRDLGIPVSSWIAVKPNRAELPSNVNLPRLGAELHHLDDPGNVGRIKAYKYNS